MTPGRLFNSLKGEGEEGHIGPGQEQEESHRQTWERAIDRDLSGASVAGRSAEGQAHLSRWEQRRRSLPGTWRPLPWTNSSLV